MSPGEFPSRSDRSPSGQSDATTEPSSAWSPRSELEELRTRIHRRLDHLESLVLERLTDLDSDQDRSEESTRLEEVNAQLQAELDQCREELEAQAKALEQERIRLAEAWERVEREQIALSAMARSPGESARAVPTSTGAPSRQSPSGHQSDSTTSDAILRQFEVVRRDVRRSAKNRQGA